MGALGAALATMVANLSSHKRGWDDRWEEFSDWADKGKRQQSKLLALIDRDTDAFNGIMDAFSMPKASDDERIARTTAIEEATVVAIEVPLRVMQVALESMETIDAMVRIGNPNSVSDAAVGALCARSAVLAANLNVQINVVELGDVDAAKRYLAEGQAIEEQAIAKEQEILRIARSRISS
jgi:glutamate formiminotransferase/formiminotetrahydrofolate cyclodeaminase